MNRQWRVAAESNAREYRKKKAYVRGVEDAAEAGYEPTQAYREAKRWIWVVESVERTLKEAAEDKHRFFVAYYGLHEPRFGHSDGEVMARLGRKLHISRSALFAWRLEAQNLLVVAAVQAGLFRPFLEEERGDGGFSTFLGGGERGDGGFSTFLERKVEPKNFQDEKQTREPGHAFVY